MTEINTARNKRRRVGVDRPKRHSLKTDMTPMVDLGFLLITFFVMTVQLSKPSVVDLNMTKDGPPVLLGNSNALTILLDKDDRVYYYEGDWKEAYRNEKIFQTNFSANNGLRKVIQEKQQWLDSHDQKQGRKELMLLIKASNGSSYENLLHSLDEALINVVEKYAALSAEPEETAWMKKQQ